MEEIVLEKKSTMVESGNRQKGDCSSKQRTYQVTEDGTALIL